MKLLWKILIPVITTSVLIVAPVIVIYSCFYETVSDSAVTFDENFNTDTYFSDVFVHSLNDSKNSHKMDLSVSKDDLNNFLHKTLSKENGIPTDYVHPIYCDIQDNNYIFHVGLSVPMFQTELKLTTHLEVLKDESGDDDYTFTIDDCKLGRISGITNFAFSIASNFVSDSSLESSLANSGVHMSVSLKEGKITYKEADLVSDIKSFLSSDENDTTELLLSCLDDFLAADDMTFNPNNGLTLSLDLEKFSSNEYLDASKEKTLDLDGCISKVKTLANASIIDPDHYQDVYQYLVYGYDNSTEESQNYLKDKDFSSIGISDVTSYAGIVYKSSRSLVDVIGDQVVSIEDLAVNRSITFMSESQLNEYVSGKGFIGYSYLLVDSTNTILNYITVDNFYTNMYAVNGEGHMILTAGLSFNGYETTLSFDLKQNDEATTSSYQIAFKVDCIKFGSYVANDKISDFLFKLIQESLSGDKTVIVDSSQRSIVIDFSPSIDDTVKAAVNLLGTPKMKIEGDGLNDDTGRVLAYIK